MHPLLLIKRQIIEIIPTSLINKPVLSGILQQSGPLIKYLEHLIRRGIN